MPRIGRSRPARSYKLVRSAALSSSVTVAAAGLAHGTGTALQVPAPAGLAHGTGSALQVPAPAGLASGTGTPPPSGLAQAALAHGTGTALTATFTAHAGLATAAGTALPGAFWPSSAILDTTGLPVLDTSGGYITDTTGGVNAGAAAGTGAAGNPAVLTSALAPAGLAHASGAAAAPQFFAVGTLGSATANGFTITPHTVGDFILLWVTSETTADYATALSGSNITWSVLVAHHAFTNNAVVQTVFIGQVTSTSGAAQTITFSTGSPTLRIAWQEFFFAGSYANLALDASGTVDLAANGTMPPVTPARSNDMYAGYVFDAGSGVAGTTAGFTYQLDTNTNQFAYGLSRPNSTQTPNIGDTGGTSGIGVMLYNAGINVSAGLASGAGTAQPPVASTSESPVAGLASGAGTAFQIPAPAQLASGAGTALPSPFSAPAGLAHGTGTALQPGISASSTVPAGLAAGTGAAPVFGQAQARPASGAGAALQPTTTGSTTVFPGLATGAGSALSPSQAQAGLAHGTGSALQVPSRAGLAAGAGTALPPVVAVAGVANAGLAHGTGTAVPPLVVTFRVPENLSAAFTYPSYGGAVVPPVYGGAVTVPDLGGTLALADLGGGLTGWTMQQLPLALSEFNDETIAVAITNNGSPYNLTSATVNMLFKTQAGTPDANALILSSGGGSPAITITNASAGQCSVAIPRADLSAETYNFYRIDVVVSSLQNTAIFGSISWTSL